ncbi:MAG: hypothetical protein ACI91T_002129, partial [Natronomonas sp.]
VSGIQDCYDAMPSWNIDLPRPADHFLAGPVPSVATDRKPTNGIEKRRQYPTRRSSRPQASLRD